MDRRCQQKGGAVGGVEGGAMVQQQLNAGGAATPASAEEGCYAVDCGRIHLPEVGMKNPFRFDY